MVHARVQLTIWCRGPTAKADRKAISLAVINSQGGAAGGRKLNGFAGIIAVPGGQLKIDLIRIEAVRP